jgi:hypothetical protein
MERRHLSDVRTLFVSLLGPWLVTVCCLHTQPVASTAALSTGSPTRPWSTWHEERAARNAAGARSGRTLITKNSGSRKPHHISDPLV